MAKILIVEDDKNIAKVIATTLEMVGYDYDTCASGTNAVKSVFEGSFDLILLDIMIPELDGFEVMERIREKGVPVIFLTAMQNVADKVKGLRLGADDYIVKPFEALELLARIESVLRRANKGRTHLTYEDIVLDVERHTVTKKGRRINLTPKEFDVLTFFMQNVDVAITRERLLACIWGYEFVGESRTVDIHVQQMRRKMGLQNKLITIPKLGYRLESR